jgi:hypothetical protein
MARRPQLDRDLDRSLVPGETAIVAVRHHWLSLHREIFLAIAATVFAFWVDLEVAPSAGGGRPLHNLSLLLWWAAIFWLVWSVLNWRREWFVATDKRFLLFYGFIRRKVAMMPLQKVTDMTFDQSLLGRMIGYGTFVMESAGQGQALSVVTFVPNAQSHYQAICAQLFGSGATTYLQPPGGAGPAGPRPDDGPGGSGGSGGWGGPGDEGPRPSGRGPAAVPASTGPRPDPTADPVQRSTPESWYRSSNLGAPSRLGDTGEIPVVGAAGAAGAPGAPWAPWVVEPEHDVSSVAADELDPDDRHAAWADEGDLDDSDGRDDSHAREIPLYPPAHWSDR